MRSLTTDQNTSISSHATTLARLLFITTLSGAAFYMTDCDVDIVYDGNTYTSAEGFDVSAIVTNVGTQNSSVTLDFFIGTSGLTSATIDGGLLDDALAVVSFIDYMNISRGAVELYRGRVTSIDYADTIYATLTCEPLLSRDVDLTVDMYSSNCTTDLGSALCTVNIDATKKNFTVASVSNLQTFNTDLTDADTFYDNGIVLFTSGNNEGLAIEIGAYLQVGGQFVVRLLLPFAVAPGDTGTAYKGCDKTPTTCNDVFDNIANYRGLPSVGLLTSLQSTVTLT